MITTGFEVSVVPTPSDSYEILHFYVKPTHGGGWSYFGNPNRLSFYKWTNKKDREQHSVKFEDIPDYILDELKNHSGQIYCKISGDPKNITFDDIVKTFVPQKDIE